jgi:hypothetical protein
VNDAVEFKQWVKGEVYRVGFQDLMAKRQPHRIDVLLPSEKKWLTPAVARGIHMLMLSG